MQQEYQFMVDFTLPKVLSEDFLRQIPHQRARVNKLFRDGKLVNYALSLDNSKIWAIVCANSELDVLQLISQLPLSRYMQYRINLLTFYNAVNADAPVFSVN
jgi:hypothetical protein